MPALEQLGMQAAQQGVSGIMGMILGNYNDKRQLKQQEKLQNLQITGNKAMIDYQKMKDYEMWEKTNYAEQVKQLEKAGLNPALLYGMGGGGGTTTGGSGGGVSGATAPTGGGEIPQMLGMGMQYGITEAQKKLIEAQTENVKAQTEKTSGVDTEKAITEIESLTQGISNSRAQQELTEIQGRIARIEEYIKSKTADESIERIGWEVERAANEVEKLHRENTINKATMENKIKIVQGEMLGIFLKNALTKAQTNATVKLTEAELDKMAREAVQSWDALRANMDNATTAQRAQSHKEWVEDIAESSKLPIDLIEKAVQAIIIKQVIQPGGTQPIKGFHKR